jgi:hypothetical protein
MTDAIHQHTAAAHFYHERLVDAPPAVYGRLRDLAILQRAIARHPEREAVLVRFAARAGDPAFLRFFRVMAIENEQ